MIAVIIAGGSGTRLWPLSTPDFPKHLLNVGNEEQSLLQKTYDRVSTVADHVYVITEKSHAHHVRDQLPEVDEAHCVVEPCRRGTANCTLLALAHIADKHNSNEPIVILWADHYIRDVEGFSHSMRLAASASEKGGKIVLVGVEPTYPATGFGYIKKDSRVNDEDMVYIVDSFKEKPDFATAESYIRSGKYLWNSGYFIGSIDSFLHAMENYAPDMLKHYNGIKDAENEEKQTAFYLQLESSNIDTALLEKVQELLVVPATFDWLDLGSYVDLHKATESDELGNHIHGNAIEIKSVENSFIHNHESKPVAVIGLDNIVVINTKDGILVARKDLSQAVGEISKKLSEKEKS